MNLILYDSDHKYTEDFIEWLIEHLQWYFKLRVNKDKLRTIEEYVNNMPVYRNVFKKHISIYETLLIAMFTLTHLRVGDKTIISIDTNLVIPNTFIKVYNICRLVNYGCMVLPAYPILSETFTYFSSNIDKLYKYYLEGYK